ncbi:hypothetical protein MC885_003697 [Smutsia gigantea]|nr:hypothetical protein MC885_003697 [Smutsia gigantea]
MAFLLLKYCTKEQTTRVEMLELVTQDHQDHIHVIFSQASKGLQQIFGIDMKEVDPSGHTYVLVLTLGLTWNGVNEEQRQPKTGLLVLLLGIILLRGCQVPEKELCLVYSGRKHFIYGEPRKLITRVCVQEQYLVYWQVPNSYSTCFELLWGPRAHTEAGKWQVLKILLRLISMATLCFLSPSEEARSNEEQGPWEEGRPGLCQTPVRTKIHAAT